MRSTLCEFTPIVDHESLKNNIRSLGPDQLKVFNIVQNHSKGANAAPLFLFCTSCAGTGKSFLLPTLVEYLRICHPKLPESGCVVITVPTGLATRNVCGLTMHSVFKVPVQ